MEIDDIRRLREAYMAAPSPYGDLAIRETIAIEQELGALHTLGFTDFASLEPLIQEMVKESQRHPRPSIQRSGALREIRRCVAAAIPETGWRAAIWNRLGWDREPSGGGEST